MACRCCSESISPIAADLVGIPNVAALRALPGAANRVVALEGYTTLDGRQGLFQWDTANGVDDGVLRFNAGGLASNTAGWKRIWAGAIDAEWAGAILDGITNDSAALQRGIDVAAANNVPLVISGPAKASGLTISNPTRILLQGRGGITAVGLAAVMFTVNNNLRIDGDSPAKTTLIPAVGGIAFKLNNWPFGVEGDKFFELNRLRVDTGETHIDTTGVTQFQGGLLNCNECIFSNASGISHILSDSVFYTFHAKTQFLFNATSADIGQATESIFTDCFFEAKSVSTTATVILRGAHHVRFDRCDFFGYTGNLNPDVIIIPINDGATGYDYFDDCRFGAERELNLSTTRRRILIANPDDSTLALQRLVLRGTEFLRISGFAFTSIGRASNIATATVSTGFDSIGHLANVGDPIYVINTTDPSFSGPAIITAKTLLTISWSSPGPDVTQAFGGGLVASADTSAIQYDSPVAGLDIDECQFDNYAYAIDDTNFIETQESRGHSGGNIWGACNRITGPLGFKSQETKSGGFKGFQRAYPDTCSAIVELTEPKRETRGLRNRIQLSEDLTGWGVIGFTNIAGEADPLGGTTAFLIQRAGVDQIVTDSGTGWGTTEGTVRAIDMANLGPTAWFQCWAKAGSSSTLWLMIIDAAGRTQWAKTVSLGADWKLYKLPIAFVDGYTAPLSLIVSCGGVNAQSGDCYIWHPAIDDYGGDYLPTPAAAYLSDTAGTRFERPVILAGGSTFPGLTALRSVVTDASKNVVSGQAIDAAATASTIALRDASGGLAVDDLNAVSINVSGLTASKVVVTDGSKNLASDAAIDTAATASTIVKRDASGGAAFDDVNAATLSATSTSADSPISRLNGGHATLSSFTDANYTASAAEAAAQTILVPNVPITADRYLAIASTAGRMRIVHNSNATFNILVIQAGFSGLSATVPPQSTRVVFFDGTNMW